MASYHISDSAVKAADMHKPIGLWGCHKQESVTQRNALRLKEASHELVYKEVYCKAFF